MIKKDKFIISKISIFCVGLVFATVVYFFTQQQDYNDSLQSDFKALASAKKDLQDRLQKRWALGDLEEQIRSGQLSCPKLEIGVNSYHPSFLECNPLYLECFLKSAKEKVKFLTVKSSSQSFYFKWSGLIEYDRRQNPILSFNTQENKPFKIKLQNTCRDTFLPKRKYSAGPRSIELLWDNFDQNIFIDKFYVTNLDVFLWNKEKTGNLYEPSTNLTTVDRIRYCQSIGKQLMESRYINAGSYYIDTESKNPNYIFKFPYPWTKKRKIDLSMGIKERDCGSIYARDCENIRVYKFHEPTSTTWMGMHKALGSYPEGVINKFIPKANLKISSFYLPFEHPLQIVGQRIEQREENIIWEDPYTNKKVNGIEFNDIKVGFRCVLNK